MKLSDHEIERLAAMAYYDDLKEDDEKRADGMTEEARYDYLKLLDTVDGMVRESLALGDIKAVESYTRELLESQGITVDKTSESFTRLSMKILESMVKANQDKLSRIKGQVIPTPPKPAPMKQASGLGGDSPTITQINGMWAKEHIAGGSPEKTYPYNHLPPAEPVV